MSHPTTRLYLAENHLPVTVPVGRRLLEYSCGWWTVKAGLTTVHGAEVYVELERELHPWLIPIRRDKKAQANAEYFEGLASMPVEAPEREAEVLPWAR